MNPAQMPDSGNPNLTPLPGGPMPASVDECLVNAYQALKQANRAGTKDKGAHVAVSDAWLRLAADTVRLRPVVSK